MRANNREINFKEALSIFIEKFNNFIQSPMNENGTLKRQELSEVNVRLKWILDNMNENRWKQFISSLYSVSIKNKQSYDWFAEKISRVIIGKITEEKLTHIQDLIYLLESKSISTKKLIKKMDNNLIKHPKYQSMLNAAYTNFLFETVHHFNPENAEFYYSLVTFLLRQGVDPNLSDEYGNFILPMIFSNFDAKLLELLLSSGADPNIKFDELSIQDYTLLHLVCSSSSVNADVIRLLLKFKANPVALDSTGSTPLHDLCGNEQITIEALETILKSCPAEAIEIQNKLNRTPLFLACLNKNVTLKMVKTLFEHGKIDSNYLMATAIGAACHHSNPKKEIIEFLLNHCQKDINVFLFIDEMKNTILHYACGNVNLSFDILKLLIKCGGYHNINSKNNVGITPVELISLDFDVNNENKRMFLLFLLLGADCKKLDFEKNHLLNECHKIKEILATGVSTKGFVATYLKKYAPHHVKEPNLSLNFLAKSHDHLDRVFLCVDELMSNKNLSQDLDLLYSPKRKREAENENENETRTKYQKKKK